jgi:glycosyltransferase involved in cell wall biosynthesis
MKIAMIFPSRESEKAISGYSVNLVNGLKKNKVNVKAETYTAGSPSSFFKKISKLKNYDIIHIQHEYNMLGYYGLPFFLIFAFLWFKNKRIITTMHTVLSQKQKFRGNFIKNFFRKLLYFFQNRLINLVSDYIIVHADFHQKILMEEYGVKKTKIKVFLAGVPEKVKITQKQKAKKELNLSGNVYLIIGNLVPDHGVDIILKQADKIGKTILVVVNPKAVNDRKQKRLTNYIDYCTNYVKEKNLSKYVRFDIKPLDDENPEWWLYFSAADLVLQAYKGEILSGIFMHAMAAKKPVIASNIKFFREILKNFGCMKIISREEDYAKIIREAMKPKNYNKMVKECARYLKENSWTAISGKYKDLYDKIIKLS